MIISHNMMAMNAMRQYNMVTGAKQKNTEKLSSGYRINRAADDAAGLAISEKMRRQVRGLTQASANVQDGISFVQVADGALNEVDDMLQRINELSNKASTETLTDSDRANIDEEIQHIKAEMNRIFGETTFNDRKIWDTNAEGRKVIDYESEQALTVSTNRASYDITDDNCGIIPKTGLINVLADSDGLNFSWTGYNGTTYTTDKISWEDYKNQNYTVEAKDLFSNPDLFDGSGSPLINFTYQINPIEEATTDDIINTLRGAAVSVSSTAPLSASFENASGSAVSTSLISSVGASIYYNIAYNSHINGTSNPYSFDNGVDEVIEPTSRSGNMSSVPSYSTVEAAKSDNTKFAFTFNMDGIGEVTATSSSLSYWSNDGSAEAENIWWYKVTDSQGITRTYNKNYSSSADLAGIMKLLTDSDKPGVLSTENGGCSKTGGYLSMTFDMRAGGTSIGTISMSMRISKDDTEQSVLDKVKNAFNTSTVLDLYTTDSSEKNSRGYTASSSAKTNKINVPIYKALNSLTIQAGSEEGQTISIEYDSLSNHVLKINNTKADTVENARNAIDEVKYAMQVVNGQRTYFGAMQNRLEHTYDNLNNVVENTTDAESKIRDTDMAKAMVSQSLMNILEQAGASMMAQANQSQQGVMTLLK